MQHLGANVLKVSVTFTTFHTTLLTSLQSEALQLPHQIEMQLVRMLSMVLLQNVVRMCRGWGRRYDFLTSAAVFKDQLRLSVMRTPRNLLLLTTSTAVLLIRRGV